VRWSNKKRKIIKHKSTASSPAGFNRFTYANNNPLSGKDIDGNRPLYSGIRTREFYESTSKSLMPQYMSLLETQSQIYNAEQSTLNQFIQESIITNPFETPYDLYIDGIRVRSGTAGYNMLMDWAMRGRTDMLGAVTIATYGGLSTNSGVVYDMGALLDIAIENYQQEIIELQTAASKAQSKEELEELQKQKDEFLNKETLEQIQPFIQNLKTAEANKNMIHMYVLSRLNKHLEAKRIREQKLLWKK
jgi:hypothetical protein